MAVEAPGASLCEESMGVGELEGRADLSVCVAHQEVSAEVGGALGFLLVLYADKDSGDSGKAQIAIGPCRIGQRRALMARWTVARRSTFPLEI